MYVCIDRCLLAFQQPASCLAAFLVARRTVRSKTVNGITTLLVVPLSGHRPLTHPHYLTDCCCSNSVITKSQPQQKKYSCLKPIPDTLICRLRVSRLARVTARVRYVKIISSRPNTYPFHFTSPTHLTNSTRFATCIIFDISINVFFTYYCQSLCMN